MGMYKLPAIVKGGITRWFPFHANGILRTDASNLLPENEWMREWMIILPGASCQKNTKPEPTSLPQRTVERTVTQVQTCHFALPPPPPPPHLAALAERLELGNDHRCSLSGIWDAWSISLSFWCLVLAMAFGPFAVGAELGFSNPFAPHCSVASWLRPSGGSAGPGEPLWEQGPGGGCSLPPQVRHVCSALLFPMLGIPQVLISQAAHRGFFVVFVLLRLIIIIPKLFYS